MACTRLAMMQFIWDMRVFKDKNFTRWDGNLFGDGMWFFHDRNISVKRDAIYHYNSSPQAL
jgi:hypothetical protein